MSTSENTAPVSASADIRFIGPEYAKDSYDERHRWQELGRPADFTKPLETEAHICEVHLGNGAYVGAVYCPLAPNEIRIGVMSPRYGSSTRDLQDWDHWGKERIDVDPFIKAEVIGSSYHKEVEVPTRSGYGWSGRTTTVRKIDGYSGQYDYRTGHYTDEIPYNYLKVRVSTLDGSSSADVELRFPRPEGGTVDLKAASGASVPVQADFFGKTLSWTRDIQSYQDFHSLLKHTVCLQGTEALWKYWLDVRKVNPAARPTEGVKAVEGRKTIKPNLEKLEAEEPVLWRFFAWLHDKRTSDKTSNNKLLAAMLEAVGSDYEALRDVLRKTMSEAHNAEPEQEYGSESLVGRTLCLTLPGAKEKIEDVQAKSRWQFAKGAKAQALVLGVSADRHPKLLAAIEASEVPMGVFHEPGNEDALVNVEFDLIEKAFNREGWQAVLSEISQNASRRTTYTKRFTSYVAFLFRVEKYLDRNAPREGGWKAMPKFVQSQWELEMDEATEEGTTKKRSALTPVADNETGIVTVPYVAMAVSGIRTTYCYSDQYTVVEEGLNDTISNGIFDRDVAEKLNGRDDYGLCFYTLSGTATNTGYPTFLVIFERTTAHGTRVHFHRVHPSRKRGPNGSMTPANRLIEECYRYMAGNIRAEEIMYQQGDILLLKCDGPAKAVEESVPVFGFENHAFVPLPGPDGERPPVRLVKTAAKEKGNRMGWIYAEAGMRMPHPEHEPIENIPPGWYEVRRCKSWEANPTAVWSLSID